MGRIIILLFLVIGISCKSKSVHNNENVVFIEDTNKSDSVFSNSYDTSMFSSFEMFTLAKNSPKEEILMMHKKSDLLQIFTGDGLVNNLFGYKCLVDSVQHYNNNIFSVEEDTSNKATNDYTLVFDNSKIIISEYKEDVIPENAEQLAEYHHKKPNTAFIKKATILNQEIDLNKDFKVGMGIKRFFEYFFGDKNKSVEALANNINEIELYHVMDEEAPFVFFEFKNGILKSVVVRKEFETN